MNDTEFPNATTWIYDDGTDTVQFLAKIMGRRILCRISLECMEDNFGARDAHKDVLLQAINNDDAITSALIKLFEKRQFEPDGSLLLRSMDLRRG